MSTITTYPLNGVDYDAADVAAYESARTSGVYSADEDFSVTAAGGLDVTVGAGRAWVHPSRFAGYSITKREPETVTLPLADGTRPRIDRILLRYDAAARKTSLLILTGDPASTPTAPAITRTELTYDLCLAEISRPAGSTEITTGQITDTRLDETLCGVMSDGVTGLPTAQLLNEARARIAEVEETASDSATAADKSQRAAAQNQTGAEAARDAAAGSARAAGTSETNAGQSAEKAATSEGNAKESETKSKASEEAAAKSEAAAKASKTAAAKSESASADSADKAKAEADRAAQITTNTFIYAYDLTLAPSGWAECSDEAAVAAGLAYQYDAALADCTDRLEPSATVAMVSIPAAQKAGLGAVCESRAGAVRFWAAKLPEAEISLRLLLTNRTGEEVA